jgi:hypothetical protein
MQQMLTIDTSDPNPRDFYSAFVRALGTDLDAPGMEDYDDHKAPGD